jgi:hypothetical protein
VTAVVVWSADDCCTRRRIFLVRLYFTGGSESYVTVWWFADVSKDVVR